MGRGGNGSEGGEREGWRSGVRRDKEFRVIFLTSPPPMPSITNTYSHVILIDSTFPTSPWSTSMNCHLLRCTINNVVSLLHSYFTFSYH
jgi:hypothetical protein